MMRIGSAIPASLFLIALALGQPVAATPEPPALTAAAPLPLSGASLLSATFMPAAAGLYLQLLATCPDTASDLRVYDHARNPLVFTTGLGGTAQGALITSDVQPLSIEIRIQRDDQPHVCTLAITALRLPTAADYQAAADFQTYARAASAKDPRSALAGFHPATSDRGLALSLANSLTRAYLSAGAYEDAIRTAEAALPLAGPEDVRSLTGLRYAIALGHLQLQHFAAAAPLFEQALALARQAKQRYETAASLHNLSVTHWAIGRCPDALEEAQQALVIRREIHDRRGQAYSLLAIAKDYLCLGLSQEALDTYSEVLPIWRELRDQRSEAAVLNDRGVVFLNVGDWDDCANALHSSLALRTSLHDAAGMGESLTNLGELKLARQEWAAARGYSDRALTLLRTTQDRRATAYALSGRVRAQLEIQPTPELPSLLKEAVDLLHELGDRSGEAWTWQVWAKYHRVTGDLNGARQADERALEIEQAAGDHVGETVALVDLARLYHQQHEDRRALASIDRALSNIETARADLAATDLRLAYLASKLEAYALRLALVGETDGFATSEQAHARVLLDAVSQKPARAAAPALEIQRDLLDGRTTLLEYFVGVDASYLFVVTPGSIKRIALPGRAVLRREVQAFYTAITERSRRDTAETLAERTRRLSAGDEAASRAVARLRQVLLAPARLRPDQQRVIIVPDGPLAQVPFALLLNDAAALPREVVCLPSASVLLELRRRPAATSGRTLIVADPSFEENSSLARLPGSREEAAAVSARFPSAAVDTLTGPDASLARLRSLPLGRYGILHFATHAIVDSAQPERSGIALSTLDAQGRRQAGFLALREITRLPVHARLVVLSACRSAAGKEVTGEGDLGLSRGFLYAGAHAVLATLWSVDDRATAAFMDRFYQALIQQHQPAGVALRTAQDWMRHHDRWNAPYYWAAFSLTGDWR